MKEISKKEAIRLHREMWSTVAEMIDNMDDDKFKQCLPQTLKFEAILKMESWEGFLGTVRASCFCCEYDTQRCDDWTDKCQYCPIKFDKPRCYTEGSVYDRFYNSVFDGDRKQAVKLARKIAFLEERK